MTAHQSLLPPGWKRPRGYANGIAASGRMVFTAGVVGWDAEERFVASDLAGQFRILGYQERRAKTDPEQTVG